MIRDESSKPVTVKNVTRSKGGDSSHKSPAIPKYKSEKRDQQENRDGPLLLNDKHGFSWLNSTTTNRSHSHPSSSRVSRRATTKLSHPSEKSTNLSPLLDLSNANDMTQNLQNLEATKKSTCSTKPSERLPMRRLLENEVELDDLPQGITVADLKIRFPALQDVEWGKNQAKVILKFKTVEETEVAIENSDLRSIGNQVLSWAKAAHFGRHFRRFSSKTGGRETNLIDGDTKYSNMSNLFTSKIYVTGLSMSITEDKLLSIFPGALSIVIEHWKRGKMATIEFDTSILAAKACYLAKQKNNLFGKKFYVSPRKPKGYKKYKELMNIQKIHMTRPHHHPPVPFR